MLAAGAGAGHTAAELCGLLRVARANNFAVLDDLGHPIAAGVFAKGAALNHSCQRAGHGGFST